MPHIIVIKNNKYLMFDECDDVYVNAFKSEIAFKGLEGKSCKKITNIYNKENILGKTWRDLIRIIPIKDNDKFKNNKLEIGIITINLSNIRNSDGTKLYKNIYINLNYYLYSCYINSLYYIIILCVTKSSPLDGHFHHTLMGKIITP